MKSEGAEETGKRRLKEGMRRTTGGQKEESRDKRREQKMEI